METYGFEKNYKGYGALPSSQGIHTIGKVSYSTLLSLCASVSRN